MSDKQDQGSSQSHPVLVSNDQSSAEPSAVVSTTALTSLRDSAGRINSYSLVEAWGRTEVEGWDVEFVRSLNGLRVQLRLRHPDGREADYGFSLMPALQAAIERAVCLESIEAPPISPSEASASAPATDEPQ